MSLMASWIRRFVDFLLIARWPLLALAAILAIIAYAPSKRVRFDRTIENMFAKDDPLLAPYQRLKQQFGGNEVVMAVYRDEELLHASGRGIERLANISGQMKKVAGVQDVLSLAEVNALLEQLEATKRLGNVLNLFGPRETWKGPAILNPKNPLAVRFRELFAGYTHSSDGQTAAVVCMLQPVAEMPPQPAAGDIDPRSATIRDLEQIIQNLPGE